ncbi:pre-mRNA-processing protein 40C isoform X1 [Tanacetum coccineum]
MDEAKVCVDFEVVEWYVLNDYRCSCDEGWTLIKRCAHEYRALLADVITIDAAAKDTFSIHTAPLADGDVGDINEDDMVTLTGYFDLPKVLKVLHKNNVNTSLSWTDAKPKLEKDPQGRAAKPRLDQSDLDKLFHKHIKSLYDRCAHEYKALLADVITTDAAAKDYEDGKTVFNSWSTAKRLLKDDVRYNKMPRKDMESLWLRHVDDLQRKGKPTVDQDLETVD